MPTTGTGLPYPADTATPDVPRDMKALAEAVDTRLPMVSHAGNDVVRPTGTGLVDINTFMVDPVALWGCNGDPAAGTAFIVVGAWKTGPNLMTVSLYKLGGGAWTAGEAVRLRWVVVGNA